MSCPQTRVPKTPVPSEFLLPPMWEEMEEAAVTTGLGAEGQQTSRGVLVAGSLLARKVGWPELRTELGREVRSWMLLPGSLSTCPPQGLCLQCFPWAPNHLPVLSGALSTYTPELYCHLLLYGSGPSPPRTQPRADGCSTFVLPSSARSSEGWFSGYTPGLSIRTGSASVLVAY